VPPLDEDRMLSPDIARADTLIRSGALTEAADLPLPTLNPSPAV
jgi:hypothetical protein